MKIAVLREAGGLGDIICTEPVVRGLYKKYPDAEIWYACLPEYKSVVEMWGKRPCVYYQVERNKRRDRDGALDTERWPYLAAIKDFDLVIDLFCPAYIYERKMKNLTDKNRVELFCGAAGVEVTAPQLFVSDDMKNWAKGWLCGKGIDISQPTAGLQPISCGKRRNWPREKWQDLQKKLSMQNIQTVTFHTYPAAIKSIGGIKATGLNFKEIAAIINECNLIITPDSGLLHMSSALGIPTLSLWGSTSPTVTLKQYSQAEFIWKDNHEKKPFDCKVPCYSMRGCLSGRCINSCMILKETSISEVGARALETLRKISCVRGGYSSLRG